MATGPGARLMLSLVLAASLCGCQHQVTSVPDLSSAQECPESSSPAVTWFRAPRDSRLDRWCAQVGSPVVLTVAADTTVRLSQLLVISWNVHVGGGRVVELVESLRQRAASAHDPAAGFILLLQEAYRAGDNIPEPRPGGGIPDAIRPDRPGLDVTALGRYLGMSVAYVPSMRNGRGQAAEDREDRGNAVLSTEPLSDLEAIELPFGHQRRVAVAATVTPRSGFPRLRVVAAHFDTVLTRGQRAQARHLAGALDGVRGGRQSLPLVVGIDTNDIGGADGATVAAIARAAPLVTGCGNRRTSSLFRLDFMFSTLAASETTHCRTLGDAFGSDHRPVVLTLSAGEPASD